MARIRNRLYLLRLWCSSDNGEWRVVLENPTRGERYGFGTLADFYEFLGSATSGRIWQGNRLDSQMNDEHLDTHFTHRKGQEDDFEDAL